MNGGVDEVTLTIRSRSNFEVQRKQLKNLRNIWEYLEIIPQNEQCDESFMPLEKKVD